MNQVSERNDAAQGRNDGGPARIKSRIQKGYSILVALLSKAGQDDLVQRLSQRKSVDEVMAGEPELVPVLLGMAWKLRADSSFADLFQSQETGAPVDTEDEMIAPCGRSFNQIKQSHLFATARLYLDRAEREFAIREAKRARIKWREQQEEARQGLKGKLSGMLSKTKEPSFEPEGFRRRFPGYGLYDLLKPHLRDPSQFTMIRAYALLSTRKAEILGDLLPRFTHPDQVKYLAGLDETDIAVLRGVARTYAEVRMGLHKSRKGRNDPAPLDDAMERRLDKEEQRVFEDLLANHHPAIDQIRTMGKNADKLVKQLTPLFGEDVWKIIADPKVVDNVINTPDHLMSALGPFCQFVTPQLSQIFLQMNDQEIIKDVLRFCREIFKADEFAHYLSDSSRLAVWSSLPKKFNNHFKYQRDALKGGALRNEEDLRTVSAGIFESLRQGKVL